MRWTLPPATATGILISLSSLRYCCLKMFSPNIKLQAGAVLPVRVHKASSTFTLSPNVDVETGHILTLLVQRRLTIIAT
jgi:hypothetical protein